jgi:tetratricopeptide (TPR) repeat protein
VVLGTLQGGPLIAALSVVSVVGCLFAVLGAWWTIWKAPSQSLREVEIKTPSTLTTTILGLQKWLMDDRVQSYQDTELWATAKISIDFHQIGQAASCISVLVGRFPDQEKAICLHLCEYYLDRAVSPSEAIDDGHLQHLGLSREVLDSSRHLKKTSSLFYQLTHCLGVQPLSQNATLWDISYLLLDHLIQCQKYRQAVFLLHAYDPSLMELADEDSQEGLLLQQAGESLRKALSLQEETSVLDPNLFWLAWTLLGQDSGVVNSTLSRFQRWIDQCVENAPALEPVQRYASVAEWLKQIHASLDLSECVGVGLIELFQSIRRLNNLGDPEAVSRADIDMTLSLLSIALPESFFDLFLEVTRTYEEATVRQTIERMEGGVLFSQLQETFVDSTTWEGWSEILAKYGGDIRACIGITEGSDDVRRLEWQGWVRKLSIPENNLQRLIDTMAGGFHLMYFMDPLLSSEVVFEMVRDSILLRLRNHTEPLKYESLIKVLKCFDQIDQKIKNYFEHDSCEFCFFRQQWEAYK